MTDVLLDVHGVTIRVRCGSPAQRRLLLRDYGAFEVPELRTRVPRLTVEAGQDPLPVPGPDAVTVEGLLGDRIQLTDGAIAIDGPAADTELAYFRELRSYLTATVISIVQKDCGGVDLHASCVRPPGGAAVVFTGAKKAGKSSMALAMVEHGWTYLANEMTMLWTDGGETTVATLPQAVAIAPGAQAWFADNGKRVRVARPATLPDSSDSEALYAFEHGEKIRIERHEVPLPAEPEPYRHRLQAMFFVEPAIQLAEPRLRRLDPDDAAVRMMENVEYYLRWGRGPSQPAEQLFQRTCALVQHVATTADVYHLQWCPDHRKNAATVAQALSTAGGLART